MLPVVSADTIHSYAQSMRETTQGEIADEFWEYLQETNPVMLEYIVGFTEKVRSTVSRSLFLSGIYTAITLLRRQDEAEMLEKQFGDDDEEL